MFLFLQRMLDPPRLESSIPHVPADTHSQILHPSFVTVSCHCPVSSEDRLVMNCHWPMGGGVGLSHACQTGVTDSLDWGKVDLRSLCIECDWWFAPLHSMLVCLYLCRSYDCGIMITCAFRKQFYYCWLKLAAYLWSMMKLQWAWQAQWIRLGNNAYSFFEPGY